MFPTVTFATSVWERDWRAVLLDSDYLRKMIDHHDFPFFERLLVINNVNDVEEVKKAAKGLFTRYVVANGLPPFSQLRREDFTDWQYYNALGPLTAIGEAKGEYLLFVTGDVYLKKKVNWIPKALKALSGKKKVANLIWNDNRAEAKKESYRQTWNFFVSKEGFSDQMFLIRRADFLAPIYSEIREDAAHFPRGDVWEKRVFSYMKNHDWERITFKGGSYTHENI
jgi:hypothetical protein